MKRTYVKPEMKSEAFVANEYVAACYDIYCRGMSNSIAKEHTGNGLTILWYSDDRHTSHNFIERVKAYPTLSDGRNIEVSLGSDFRTPEYTDSKGVKHWEVSVVPVPATDPHPNAS